MTKLWVVTDNQQYDSSDVVGVYSTEKKAEAVADLLKTKYRQAHCDRCWSQIDGFLVDVVPKWLNGGDKTQ
jgi:hypothetical protein